MRDLIPDLLFYATLAAWPLAAEPTVAKEAQDAMADAICGRGADTGYHQRRRGAARKRARLDERTGNQTVSS